MYFFEINVVLNRLSVQYALNRKPLAYNQLRALLRNVQEGLTKKS